MFSVQNYRSVSSFKIYFKVISCFSLLFIIFANGLYAQNIPTSADSSFSAYIDSAYANLEKAHYYDRLQYKYAEDFYHYYLNHPSTRIGKEALKDASEMWLDIGESQKLISALHHVDYTSDVWYEILRMIGVSGGFTQHDEKYMPLLTDLEQHITHPKNRTAVLYLLSSHYLRDNNMGKVKNLYHEILKLDADTFYTRNARSYLYEFETLGIGHQAPEFEAQTINGGSFSLANQNAKVLILNFWATWCGPCVREIPTLQMLRYKYDKDDLQIVSISLDQNEHKLKAFLDSHTMPWPQIRQTKSFKDKIPELYNVKALPKIIVISSDGKILAKNLRGEILKKKIPKLLE